MDIDDIELYGTFEDWFRASVDHDTAKTLRDNEAWAVGALNDSYMIWALFERFGSDISDLALAQSGMELWEIVSDRKPMSVGHIMEALIHIAAESLAHSLAHEFEGAEEEDEACL
jgi:hypothetical protein